MGGGVSRSRQRSLLIIIEVSPILTSVKKHRTTVYLGDFGVPRFFTSVTFVLPAKGFKPYCTEDVQSHFQTSANPSAQACF